MDFGMMKNTIASFRDHHDQLPLTDWRIRSSAEVLEDGGEVSTEGCCSEGWVEARVPCTVLGALVSSGTYTEPYFGDNLQRIPRSAFELPWWFRTEFDSTADPELTHLLDFDGINYLADIWLNGEKIADHAQIRGAFRRFRFDVTRYIHPGKNVLAVLVYPPKPGDFSVGFVDWNLRPPDENMGIFRPVSVRTVKSVSVEMPSVESEIRFGNPNEADLSIRVQVSNHSNRQVEGQLIAEIESIRIEKPVVLGAFEKSDELISSKEFPGLKIQNPRLWWPHTMGNPYLYPVAIRFETDEGISDSCSSHFGVRKIESYIDQAGHRGFRINEHPTLIKSAGWTDDLLLMDTAEDLETQVRYTCHMNLNSIRLEGIWGKDQTLYDLCDRYGLLLMVGWSCHWEHEGYLGKPVDQRYGGIFTPEDIELIAKSWEDQVLWLRHHPSIFVWTAASDKVPHPDLERRYIETFRRHDPTRPYVNSTGGYGSEQGIITNSLIVSDVSGCSGMKMLGPYAYTPPVYWFEDRRLGGAYGFNTETGPGAQPPHIESIRKMIPPEHLWPVDEMWDFHCGLNEFTNLDRFREAMKERLGEPATLEEFCIKAQLLNYELMRPMFEAFQANKKEATGIVQWMLNAAWPKMYWQLYDHYLRPNAAFYATRKACQKLHVLYDYFKHSIFLVNNTMDDLEELSVRIWIYDIESRIHFEGTIDVGSPAESSQSVLDLPECPGISEAYFLDLRLVDRKGGTELDQNLYWLSTTPDVLDYKAKIEPWAFYTPTKSFADLRLLNSLAPVDLEASYELTGNNLRIALHNPGTRLAFFLELGVDSPSGESILPTFWEDNYITLLPGETRHLLAALPQEAKEITPWIEGWNVKRFSLKG